MNDDPVQSSRWRLNLDRATPASQGIQDTRDIWQQPARVVAALHLFPGAEVADLGAGAGYFIPHLARGLAEATAHAERPVGRPPPEASVDLHLGSSTPSVPSSVPSSVAPSVAPFVAPFGRIWAVDRAPFTAALRQAFPPFVTQRSDGGDDARGGDVSIGVIDADVHDLELPSPVDAILACNVFHQLRDPGQALTSWRRWLASGGRLVIVDFIDCDLPIGPPRSELASETRVLAALGAARYRLVERQRLPYQYLLSASI